MRFDVKHCSRGVVSRQLWHEPSRIRYFLRLWHLIDCISLLWLWVGTRFLAFVIYVPPRNLAQPLISLPLSNGQPYQSLGLAIGVF